GMHLPGESCAGWKPLHFASEDCHHAISLMLLQHGADVNSQTSAGLTPMHLCGRLEVEKEDMLQLLLQEGADISIQDTKGRTA
ncbi:ankyrin repeat-containing domain protein, partial [Baffinella frigidus]